MRLQYDVYAGRALLRCPIDHRHRCQDVTSRVSPKVTVAVAVANIGRNVACLTSVKTAAGLFGEILPFPPAVPVRKP